MNNGDAYIVVLSGRDAKPCFLFNSLSCVSRLSLSTD